MSQRANGILRWMLLSMLILVANDLSPLVLAEGPNNIVNYPIQNYLYWSTAGEIPWTIDYTSGYNDKISLKSEPIECAGESDLRVNNMSGPAIIRFKWKMDVGPGTGQLIFSVDGKNIIECSSRDWTDFSYPLNADRSHTLEWTFRKIKSYPLWKGAGWIDDISLVRMDSQGNGEYRDQNNASEAVKWSTDNGVQIPRFISNNATGDQTKPGVNIIIEKVIYSPPNPCAIKGNVTIKPISPSENEILSEDGTMKFEYKPSDQKMVTNCTLLIDGKERAHSRDIRTNESNELTPDSKLDEEGVYRWNAICCECGGLCNSTKDVNFKMHENNNTTYVNQKNPDESKFYYKNITYAIERTNPGGTVIIEGGRYEESIVLDKPITIRGEYEPSLISQQKKDVIKIDTDNVNISGLNISGGNNGINIDGTNKALRNINIISNKISKSSSGIKVQNCIDCQITGNIIYDCENGIPVGIELNSCKNNKIYSNRIDNNHMSLGIKKACIDIGGIDNNTFKDNVFDSESGVWIKGKNEGIDSKKFEEILLNNNNTFSRNCKTNVSEKPKQ
jgi:hypothetical protein